MAISLNSINNNFVSTSGCTFKGPITTTDVKTPVITINGYKVTIEA